MKLLQIIAGMHRAAGTTVFCGELCNELILSGQEVMVACAHLPDSDTYAVDSRVKWVAIEDIVKGVVKPDLIHIHALWTPILHRVARWAYRNQVPVVWSPHGMLQKWALKNKWWKKFAALALYQWCDLHSAALLHATAQSEVEDIRRIGLKNNVVVAPLGVRLPDGGLCRRSRSTADVKTLLFVSRVQRKKGLPNLIEAWRRLPQVLRKDWQVRIVGPDQDNHTAELKSQCDCLGLTYSDGTDSTVDLDLRPRPNFIFVGPKYDSDLAAEYANADLFVLPTHSENFGSVVIEALAHGVPVITTRQAPWAALEEYECGWWIDDDVKALTAALYNAISAGNLVEMGRRGYELVKCKYSWKSVCEKMVFEYKDVLKGRDGAC